MSCIRTPVVVIILAVSIGTAVPARAQGWEFGVIGGYGFANDLFEGATGRRLDTDGAPAVGVVVDVPVAPDSQIEALYSHQRADVVAPATLLVPLQRFKITVDHWQGGGLHEYDYGQIRPFLTGVLGLTRYAADADSEIRFTLGAGGGVKIFPVSRIGVRLDGRVFTTFVDANGKGFACTVGTCLLAVDVDVAWQTEFTAGLIVRLP
jgi:hypothetical protein